MGSSTYPEGCFMEGIILNTAAEHLLEIRIAVLAHIA
jgi:hypothetical protein